MLLLTLADLMKSIEREREAALTTNKIRKQQLWAS